MLFEEIRAIAAKRKGGDDELEALLPELPTIEELRATDDSKYLENMAKAIFSAGFKWYIIKAKWPGFVEAFEGFDPETVASYDILRIDELAQDTRIVRNRVKIEATANNAAWMLTKAEQHGSFADWIADWPSNDIASLWSTMQKEAKHLGPKTSAYFLRQMGKDSFLLTNSTSAALVEHGILDAEPRGKTGATKAQKIFNEWHEETGLPYAHLSRILAYSTET
jgi:3-methyladenine DNA glycosylase Tag